MEKILNQMKKDLKIHILNNMNEENEEEMIKHLNEINGDIKFDLTVDDIELDDFKFAEEFDMNDFMEIQEEFEHLCKREDKEIINQLPIELELPKEFLDAVRKGIKDEENEL